MGVLVAVSFPSTFICSLYLTFSVKYLKGLAKSKSKAALVPIAMKFMKQATQNVFKAQKTILNTTTQHR